MTELDRNAVDIIAENLRRQGFEVRPVAGGGASTYTARKGNGKRITFGISSNRNAMEQTLSALRRIGASGTARWELPGRRSNGPRPRPAAPVALDDTTVPQYLIGRTRGLPLPDNIVARSGEVAFTSKAIDACAAERIGVFEVVAAVLDAQTVIPVRGGHPRYIRGDVCVVFEGAPRTGGTVHNVLDLGKFNRSDPRAALYPQAATPFKETTTMDTPEALPARREPADSGPRATTGEDIKALASTLPAGTRLTVNDLRKALPHRTHSALYQAADKLAKNGTFTLVGSGPAVWEVTPAMNIEPPEPEPEPIEPTDLTGPSEPEPTEPTEPTGPTGPTEPEPEPEGPTYQVVPRVPGERVSLFSDRHSGPVATIHRLPDRPGGLEHHYDLEPPPDEPDELAETLGRFARDADKLRKQEQPGTWARLLRLAANALPAELDGADRLRLTVQLVPNGKGSIDVYARWTRL